MARQESDREDLLREATALVERIELSLTSGTSETERVVAGFRANGALSVFFGDDPVYHFNAAGELRRAYYGGLLYKAERGRLISLERRRKVDEVQLLRRDLTTAEESDFLARMGAELNLLADRLQSGAFSIVGQSPADRDVIARCRSWFAENKSWPIAASPGV